MRFEGGTIPSTREIKLWYRFDKVYVFVFFVFVFFFFGGGYEKNGTLICTIKVYTLYTYPYNLYTLYTFYTYIVTPPHSRDKNQTN